MSDKISVPLAVECLRELGDTEVQKRLWLSDGSSGEVSSFTEAICGLFNDASVTRALDSGELPQELAMRFRTISDLAKKIPDNAHPNDIIDHPLMNDVRNISIELLSLLENFD